jgi:hypothetical protein
MYHILRRRDQVSKGVSIAEWDVLIREGTSVAAKTWDWTGQAYISSKV